MEEQEYHILRQCEEGHWWFVGLHEQIASLLERYTAASGLNILDAGCGTGGLLKRLRPFGSVSGLDFSEKAVELAKGRELDVEQADLNTIELPAESYDLITSVDVLYHRSIKDRVGVLQKFHSALKEDGVLYLHLPAYNWLHSDHDERVHTGHRFTLSEATKLANDAGFEIVESSYRMTLLFPLVLLSRVVAAITSSTESKTSDFSKGGLFNSVLLMILRLENIVLRAIRLPFGVSLYIVARKVMTDTTSI